MKLESLTLQAKGARPVGQSKDAKKIHSFSILKRAFDCPMKDGRKFVLKQGMGYLVADLAEAHRSSTESGVKLFIVD